MCLQTPSFTYIDDAETGTFIFMDTDVTNTPNVGSSQLVNVDEMPDIGAAIDRNTAGRGQDLSAPQGARGRNNDNPIVRTQMRWQSSTRLEDGLTKAYDSVYQQVSDR